MEEYKCEICGETFKDKGGLSRHISRGHKVELKDYYDKYLKIGDEDKCPVCGKPNKFLGLGKGYRKHCSTKCSSLNKETQAKSKTTCLKKYGVEYSLQSEEIKEKSKKTLMEEYGVSHPSQIEAVQEKMKNTFIEKYGVDNPWKSDEVKEKIKATNLEKYGTEYIGASEEIKNKIKETNLEKYGVASPFSNKDIKEKIKETNLERYGVENAAQSELVKNKMRSTIQEKYGKNWYTETEDFKEKSKQRSIENFGTEYPIQSEEIKEKIRKSNLKKYGVEHILQVPEIQEKIKETNLEKYGSENVFGSPEIREQIKKTNLEKYGSEFPIQTKEIQDKVKLNNKEKYGVEHTFQVEEFREKAAKTNLEKYGAENVFGSKEIQEKVKKTNLEKYGTIYPTQSEEIKEKTLNTNREKYGVDYPLQLEEIQEQIKKTNLEKYGAERIGASEEIQSKIRDTNREKYGVDCIFELPEIQEKIKNTMVEKYGYDHNFKVPEIQEKIKKTNLRKYGSEYIGGSKIIQEKIKQATREKYGVNNYSQIHISNINDWYNIKEFLTKNSGKFNCLDLIKYFNLSLRTLRNKIIKLGLQSHVKDFYSLSEPELEFKTLLDLNIPDINYIMHDRSIINPLELDFYFPEQRLAVEVSPTYTHQYIENPTDDYIGVTEKEYHYNKFKACEDKGIELITVFDWEDIEKVIDLIKNKLTPSQYKIYARKTKVNYVDTITKEHKEFLDNYHVLGRINNRKDCFVLELVYEDEVVGLAVYYPYRGKKLELKRLAFKEGYTVVGGASKLLKNAIIQKPEIKSIVTFSDNNLGTGSVYKTIGFDLTEDNKFSLTYYNKEHDWAVKDTSLWMVGADRLLKNFPGYKHVGIGDDLPKNDEIVMSYGFAPVYDCGYRKWEFKRK